MSEPFLGQITLFPYSFPPKNWADCAGQIMPIMQNTALFSLLGITYGGDTNGGVQRLNQCYYTVENCLKIAPPVPGVPAPPPPG